jgi:DNA polymerase (family 10)
VSKGLVLEEKGLGRGRTIVASKNEEEIYRALGLPFIPPELREGSGEVARAQIGALPRLMTDSDIRGVLHAHTNLSDGVDTLEAMVKATRAREYEYFGVADHSQSAHYAGGLSIDEIAAQHAEIDRKHSGRFRILKGIESDILADGSLDYPDEVLASFDFVVASVHSRFRLDREAQTERIIRAVTNPRTTILGHMTGRQLLRRPGYDLDIPRVLAACARHGVAVEIQVHAVDEAGNAVVRKRLRRGQVIAFFAGIPRCLVGLEACATAHHWARELIALGHEVRLMPPNYVYREAVTNL